MRGLAPSPQTTWASLPPRTPFFARGEQQIPEGWLTHRQSCGAQNRAWHVGDRKCLWAGGLNPGGSITEKCPRANGVAGTGWAKPVRQGTLPPRRAELLSVVGERGSMCWFGTDSRAGYKEDLVKWF